jgi:hypothetical protein
MRMVAFLLRLNLFVDSTLVCIQPQHDMAQAGVEAQTRTTSSFLPSFPYRIQNGSFFHLAAKWPGD